MAHAQTHPMPREGVPMTVMMVATVIHLALSAIYGLIAGWMVHRLDTTIAAVVGIALGLIAVYFVNFVNFYVIAPAMFPWFAEARNWVSVFAHALFGAVAAGTYVALRKPRAPRSERAA